METFVIILLTLIGATAVAIPRIDGFSTGSEEASNIEAAEEEAPEEETANVESSGESVESEEETETAEAPEEDMPEEEDAPEAEDLPEANVILEPPAVDTLRFDGLTGVVSGMAAPGSQIVIRDGENEIARTQADAGGNFATTFDYETPEEGGILQLAQIDESGNETPAEQALTVLPIEGGETQTATLTEEGVEVEEPKAKQLALGQMSYGSVGAPWLLTGTAAPNALVDLFVDGNKIGSATADENGVWNYQGEGAEPGTYELGLSENGGEPITQNITLQAEDITTADAGQTDNSGTDAGTGEATSTGGETGASTSLTPGQTVQIGDKSYTVQRGDSLWRIAERFYGEGQGYRYTEIFDVNSGQIKNPDLIYPEQNFEIPEED